MTVEHLFTELETFLADPNAGVICISGKWGVGKTFAWNRALRDARDNKRLSLARYSYVSLFGQNSLDDVRYAIFENTVPQASAGDEASAAMLDQGLKNAMANWRQSLSFFGAIPQASGYVAGLSKVGFFSVRRQIVAMKAQR